MEFFAFPGNIQYRPKCLKTNQCCSIPFTTAQQTNPQTTDLELGHDKVSWLMAFVDTSTTEFLTLTWTHHCEVSLYFIKTAFNAQVHVKVKVRNALVESQHYDTETAIKKKKSKAHRHRKLQLRKCLNFGGSIIERTGWLSSILTFTKTHTVPANLHNTGNEIIMGHTEKRSRDVCTSLAILTARHHFTQQQKEALLSDLMFPATIQRS